MLEKQVIIKKKRKKRVKYIGIVLVYHFSPSLLRQKAKEKLERQKAKTPVDAKEIDIQRKYNPFFSKKDPLRNLVKINVTKLLLNNNKYFYTIKYKKDFKIEEGIFNEFGIDCKYIKESFLLRRDAYNIYIVSLKRDIPLDSDSEYTFRAYLDFYDCNALEGEIDINIYDKILQNDPINIASDDRLLINSHLDNYIVPDNSDLNLVNLRDIYRKLSMEGKNRKLTK